MSSSQVLLNGHAAAHTAETAHDVVSTFVISHNHQAIETEPGVISKIVLSHDHRSIDASPAYVPAFVISHDHEHQTIETEPAAHISELTDLHNHKASDTGSQHVVSSKSVVSHDHENIETKPSNSHDGAVSKFVKSRELQKMETEPPHAFKSSVISRHDLQTINEDEEVAGLNELKKMTSRLRLSTRRPSIMQWRESLTHFQQNMSLSLDHDMDDDASGGHSDEDDDDDGDERRRKMDEAITWLRRELTNMKSQDHQLAMQLMKLRAEIQELKLQKMSNEHQELIEDARYSIVEESEELKCALFDLPMNNNFYPHNSGDDPLKDMGVTRMNLNRRRFSLR